MIASLWLIPAHSTIRPFSEIYISKRMYVLVLCFSHRFLAFSHPNKLSLAIVPATSPFIAFLQLLSSSLSLTHFRSLCVPSVLCASLYAILAPTICSLCVRSETAGGKEGKLGALASCQQTRFYLCIVCNRDNAVKVLVTEVCLCNRA
uniref:Secreted protein n=1 Tax=Ascaris lumbricoides TaxID=6252 RepID=A0A0M3I7Y1_ASCLU